MVIVLTRREAVQVAEALGRALGAGDLDGYLLRSALEVIRRALAEAEERERQELAELVG